MRTEDLFDVILAGEGQTAEFKESLTSSAKREAIQTMVAFANAQGGRIFFGVKDDGRGKGVQLGHDTQERLAKLVRDHTYPSLPFVIDDPFTYEGKTVLSVEVPRDIPPVIGVYLCSEHPISPDQRVDVSQLQAFRRVGRTNQKEDFMRLRAEQTSDPRLRVVLERGYCTKRDAVWKITARAWVEAGSGTAHDIRVHLDPSICEASETHSDLPEPYSSTVEVPGKYTSSYDTRYGFKMFHEFYLTTETVPADVASSLRIVASFKDDWGITWKSARAVSLARVENVEEPYDILIDRGDFMRRIIAFPPKMEAST